MGGTTKARGRSKKDVEEDLATLRSTLLCLIDRWVRSAKHSFNEADVWRTYVLQLRRVEARALSSYSQQASWYATRGDDYLARAHDLAKTTGLIEERPDLLLYDAWLDESRKCYRAREGMDPPHGLVQARRAA